MISRVRPKGRPVPKDPIIAPAEQSTRDRQREAELRKKREAEEEAERVKLAAEDAALEEAKVLAVQEKQAADEAKAAAGKVELKAKERVKRVKAILAAVVLTPGSVFGKQFSIAGKMVDSGEI